MIDIFRIESHPLSSLAENKGLSVIYSKIFSNDSMKTMKLKQYLGNAYSQGQGQKLSWTTGKVLRKMKLNTTGHLRNEAQGS